MDTNEKVEKSTAIDKVFDIIECLYRHGGSAKINVIASELGLYKSAVHRILGTMKARGYIYQNPDDLSYGIGSGFYKIGQLFIGKQNFIDMVRGDADRIARKYGETINFSMIDHSVRGAPAQISVHRAVVATSMLQVAPAVGMSGHSHCSASGKCLLAYTPQRIINRYMEYPLVKKTDNTITDWTVLLEELEKVRERGYAIDNEELEEGLTCIAVPILDETRIIAGVSILGASTRIKKLPLNEVLSDLRSLANCM